MLRLAAAASSSAVLPSALRAIANSRILYAPIANSEHQFVRREATPNLIISHNFSTDAKKSVDRKLVKVLKSEIKTKQLYLEQKTVPAAPADFPFTIDKVDHYKKKVNLTRELNGEKIDVCIAMPKIIREDLDSAAADGCGHDDCGDDDGSSSVEENPGVCLPEPLNLYVKIGKENGKLVDFGVQMCPHVIQVHMMSVMEPAPQSHGQLICFGMHDVEAEGELQCCLQEYLKMRGIKPCYAEFMYKYMVWTSKEGPLNTLKKMKKFIKD